jgi:LysM repeat protein
MLPKLMAVFGFGVLMLALVPLTVSANSGLADNVIAPQADGPNLLANPGMEGSYRQQCSLKTDPPWVPAPYPCDPHSYDTASLNLWATAQVPAGWAAWWRVPNNDTADPNYFNTFPHSCENASQRQPSDCRPWHNPEFRDTAGGPQETGPSRRLAGENSQKYFTFYSVHEAGLYQIVGGIKPGQRLRFSVWMEAWSSTANDPWHSVGQPTMGMKVGIDPYGGNNPWSPNIVWSPVQESFDHFSPFSVEAVAQNSVVSVWTRSQPYFAIQHNDVYVDEASLVAVGATPITTARRSTGTTRCTVTITTRLPAFDTTNPSFETITTTKTVPCGPSATTPVTSTRTVTSTQAPSSSTTFSGTASIPDTYTVVRGDTVRVIAKRFGIPWTRLVELNPRILPPNYVIRVGWVLRLK